MKDTRTDNGVNETQVIQVRYWAAARTASGCDMEEIPADGPMTLSEVLTEAVRRHPGTRLADVLGVCSVLLGDRPVATEDPGELLIPPGSTLEFLPPFAGG